MRILEYPVNHFRAWAANSYNVLMVGLLGTLAGGIAVTLLFDGVRRESVLVYSVPMAVPFVAFLADRVVHRPRRSWWLDVPVVVLALSRTIAPVPLISGHALFLTYSLLTTQTRLSRISALAMLLYVIWVKWLLQDVSLLGGALVGLIAAVVLRRLAR
ncbi:MAG TPA: hypothetical protein PLQ56_17540 [Aggregatilineales bacterium]|nr:hypothetical protein [Aggregatilineales bacterium]